jgi:hypothetical protein
MLNDRSVRNNRREGVASKVTLSTLTQGPRTLPQALTQTGHLSLNTTNSGTELESTTCRVRIYFARHLTEKVGVLPQQTNQQTSCGMYRHSTKLDKYN